MSYYDHATMMALRLGPWAGDRGEGEGETGRTGKPPRFPGRQVMDRMRGALGLRVPGRGRRDASEPIPMADPAVEGDAPRKSW
ncbi:MAG: hypothetical protein U1A06_14520 [Hoeflea sp.]|nr:hypothetical protein [Hoeflea sp.]